MSVYKVEKFAPYSRAEISVPASKSLLNRALLLAALSKDEVRLLCGDLCDDTRTLLGCLRKLGIRIDETVDGLLVFGCGGNIPCKSAVLDVGSAGTAARFLPVALAFCGGEYIFTASAQMKERPMATLPLLETLYVELQFLEKPGTFPFRIRSQGVRGGEITVSTDESTQFASAFLLTAGFCGTPFTLRLAGGRTQGSYIAMTLEMLSAFHIPYERHGDAITVFPQTSAPAAYEVEPDLSSACYFFALALLCRAKIFIHRAKLRTLQGDVQFLKLLEQRGLKLTETGEGVLADGTDVESFEGFNDEFTDFSDQTLTAAALAPFAATPSRLRGVGHIRLQECDRIRAIVENLTALGVPAHSSGEDIFIEPAPVKAAEIETFSDHRVAMAFALVGLKAGGVTIKNPECCKKTFENYFKILSDIK